MLKVWKIEYFFGGDFAESVVLANTAKEAIDLVVDGQDVLEIEKCEQVKEVGEVLTCHQP